MPFAWARDERGFILPELRMSAPARAWLAAHDAHTFMHKKWPAKTELDWLRLELDQPVDAAIVGWSARPASVPLAFDPAHPEASLPLGTVESRLARGPSLLAIVFLGALGLAIWLVGMWILPLSSGTLMEGMAHPGRWVLAILPLLALPW